MAATIKDERNGNYAEVSQNQAGDGEALTRQPAGALLDVRKREVPQDHGNDEQRKDTDDAAD
jgi:hypothetical protein